MPITEEAFTALERHQPDPYQALDMSVKANLDSIISARKAKTKSNVTLDVCCDGVGGSNNVKVDKENPLRSSDSVENQKVSEPEKLEVQENTPPRRRGRKSKTVTPDPSPEISSKRTTRSGKTNLDSDVSPTLSSGYKKRGRKRKADLEKMEEELTEKAKEQPSGSQCSEEDTSRAGDKEMNTCTSETQNKGMRTRAHPDGSSERKKDGEEEKSDEVSKDFNGTKGSDSKEEEEECISVKLEKDGKKKEVEPSDKEEVDKSKTNSSDSSEAKDSSASSGGLSGTKDTSESTKIKVEDESIPSVSTDTGDKVTDDELSSDKVKVEKTSKPVQEANGLSSLSSEADETSNLQEESQELKTDTNVCNNTANSDTQSGHSCESKNSNDETQKSESGTASESPRLRRKRKDPKKINNCGCVQKGDEDPSSDYIPSEEEEEEVFEESPAKRGRRARRGRRDSRTLREKIHMPLFHGWPSMAKPYDEAAKFGADWQPGAHINYSKEELKFMREKNIPIQNQSVPAYLRTLSNENAMLANNISETDLSSETATAKSGEITNPNNSNTKGKLLTDIINSGHSDYLAKVKRKRTSNSGLSGSGKLNRSDSELNDGVKVKSEPLSDSENEALANLVDGNKKTSKKDAAKTEEVKAFSKYKPGPQIRMCN